MQRRRGFSLVELMVAMALIVFIMAILSEAFKDASDTFRVLKGVNDLAERLRAVTGLMRRELAADHFEGRKRLSDPNFWRDGPPREGYLRIYHGEPSLANVDNSGKPVPPYEVPTRSSLMQSFAPMASRPFARPSTPWHSR